VELSLLEIGERNVFPHVGRRTQVQVRGARGPIFPIVTGTFGGVDFLHSVCGEVTDKVTQSEIQELEGSLNSAQHSQSVSRIKELLDQLPPGLFGGDDQSSKVDEIQANAAAAQMQNMNISPKEPEEFTRYAQQLTQQIYPILEFHDEIMRSITEAIENIPVLPDLIEQLQNGISMFCFSLLAPFVLPIISQVKSEMETGSSEIIQSSRDKQLIVFNDDSCSDPTHSMLSKDHFSNILNEPAGKIASQILKWAIPQITEAWDNPNVDADRTITRIINGVFHHPALREYGDDGARDGRNLMFGVVERWWREKSEREKNDLRDKLSTDGVRTGRNHKEGVHDTGHGCGKPIGFASMSGGSGGQNQIAGVVAGGLAQGLNQAFGGGQSSGGYGGGSGGEIGKVAGDALGGGILGDVVGGIAGAIGGGLLSGAFGEDEKEGHVSSSYNQDGSYTQRYTETAQKPSNYGAQGGGYGTAEYRRTEYPSGDAREEYSRHEQTGSGFVRQEESRYQSGGTTYQTTST
jgi:hypothetical protein